MTNGPEDAPRRYPYEPLGDWYDEALDLLETSTKDEKDDLPHIPTFARRMLEELKSVGLLHARDTEPPVNVRRAKVGGEQELWVRFDTYRDAEGYMVIDVVDAPRADTAILATMIAWLAQPTDFKEILEGFHLVNSRAFEEQMEKAEAFNRRIQENQDIPFEEWVEHTNSLLHIEAQVRRLRRPVSYMLPLIKYYKPADNYTLQEFNDLLEKTCYYVNDFLDALRRLQAFLEYGAPNKRVAPSVREPDRDVKAAVLHDVNGMSYRQIGERMGVPLPPDYFEIKGEHQTVRKMVGRGRRILEEAFGKVGWLKRVETMKAEKARWRSLSREERKKETDIEMFASQRGISPEEARRWLEHRSS